MCIRDSPRTYSEIDTLRAKFEKENHKDKLVILDEIGRGTSTFDGLAIAWSVLEHLHEKIKPITLFATHYHELTALSEKYSKLLNASMQISEVNNELVFSYKLKPGSAEKSYGVTPITI